MANDQSATTEIDQALAEAKANRDETAKVLAESKKMLEKLKRGAEEGKQARDSVVVAAREADAHFATICGLADKADKTFITRSLDERIALNAFVFGTPPEIAATTELSTEEAAVILDVSTRTMARAKDERDAAENVDEIPDFLLSSIPYIQGSAKGTFSYLLIEIQMFFQRRTGKYTDVGIAKLEEFKEATRARLALGIVEPNILKFMENAHEENTWPFSIQGDGTPICIYEAVKRGLLTGYARRLTISEYGGLLAKAASGRSARGVKDALEIEVPEVEVKPRKPSSPDNPRKTGM